MPEGHTLHRLARLHQRRYAGTKVNISSPQGRFSAEASEVDGSLFYAAEANGKHLFHHYGSPDAWQRTVHIHLGLYGRFTEGTIPEPPPTGQVRLRIVGDTHWTDLRGPNQCRLLSPPEVDAVKARLGPDPLRRDSKPDAVWKKISTSRTLLAVLLMDQSVLSGVGNIYRTELLFRHRLSPRVIGKSLDLPLWNDMWSDLVTLMRHGVQTGRIDTVDEEHLPENMGRPPRQDRHGGEVYVYRRTGQPCLICGTPIEQAELAGRNIYWCPQCQVKQCQT